MKKQLQIIIQRVDNGFIIRSQSDVPADNGQKIATTAEEANAIATDMILAAIPFVPAPTPPKPQ